MAVHYPNNDGKYLTDALLEVLNSSERRSARMDDHIHLWIDTGFSNLDECLICGLTRVGGSYSGSYLLYIIDEEELPP